MTRMATVFLLGAALLMVACKSPDKQLREERYWYNVGFDTACRYPNCLSTGSEDEASMRSALASICASMKEQASQRQLDELQRERAVERWAWALAAGGAPLETLRERWVKPYLRAWLGYVDLVSDVNDPYLRALKDSAAAGEHRIEVFLSSSKSRKAMRKEGWNVYLESRGPAGQR